MVGLSKLRTKYESHEAKRQLCNSFDLFLADERVLPSLPKLLGGCAGGQAGGRDRVQGGVGRAACLTNYGRSSVWHLASRFGVPL